MNVGKFALKYFKVNEKSIMDLVILGGIVYTILTEDAIMDKIYKKVI